MKNILVLIFAITIFGCSDLKSEMALELSQLKRERDSLAEILEDINKNKYVFDSIAFRDIHSQNNTYSPNSEFEMELLVVAFNPNNSYFIKYDSIYEGSLINPDTLPIVNGGFKLKTSLMDNENPIWVDMNIKNQYGKTRKGTLYDVIRVKSSK